LFVPENVQIQVILWGHVSHVSCQCGMTRTLPLLRRLFWWQSIERYFKEYVAACPVLEERPPPSHPA